MEDSLMLNWGDMRCTGFTLDPGQEHAVRIPLGGIKPADVLEAAIYFSVSFRTFNFRDWYYYERRINRGFSADRALNRPYWSPGSCKQLRELWEYRTGNKQKWGLY